MTTHQVPAIRTVLGPQEALSALWHAHQDVIGGPCETTLLGILGAHTAFETARWRSMFDWNPGNRGGHAEDGAWQTLRGATEIVNGVVVPRVAGEAGSFGAWATCADGFRSYVRFLGTASRPPAPNLYAYAWEAAKRGDVAGFCAGLRYPPDGVKRDGYVRGAYMTDHVEHYTLNVQSEYSWLLRGPLPEFLASLTPTSPPEPIT